MGLFDKWGAMYYQKDEKTGEWFITRVAYDGSINVPRFTFKTKAAAMDYIRAHGLKPQKWEV